MDTLTLVILAAVVLGCCGILIYFMIPRKKKIAPTPYDPNEARVYGDGRIYGRYVVPPPVVVINEYHDSDLLTGIAIGEALSSQPSCDPPATIAADFSGFGGGDSGGGGASSSWDAPASSGDGGDGGDGGGDGGDGGGDGGGGDGGGDGS
jgi:uncharacterized membrane protein YgcG